MKRSQSLRMHFIWIVFFIMIVSLLISGLLYFTAIKIGIVKDVLRLPVTKLLALAFSSAIIGFVLSVAVSKNVLKPINELVAGTKEIAKGNFNVMVESPQTAREVRVLTESFNQMAKELSNVEMVHNDFINNFSHEFKTPIVSIKGFAKQLQEPNLTEKERQEFTQIIIAESERLSHLSTSILQLSKLENQESFTLQKENYDLAEQLRHCLVLLQNEWEKKEIVLALDLKTVLFYGDQEMMMLLWVNLLENSIKFSPAKAVLTVVCYQHGEEIKVKISDQGIGMSDRVQRHVFDKFYQGDGSHQLSGNGLGMAIAKRVTELHQGKIRVKAKVAQGCQYTVIFRKS